MAPQKRANYTRFPVGKYTTVLKKEQEELVKNLVAENKKLKAKRAKLKRLQDRVSYTFRLFCALVQCLHDSIMIL